MPRFDDSGLVDRTAKPVKKMDILLWITVGGIADWLSGFAGKTQHHRAVMTHVLISAGVALAVAMILPFFMQHDAQNNQPAHPEQAIIFLLLNALQ